MKKASEYYKLVLNILCATYLWRHYSYCAWSCDM